MQLYVCCGVYCHCATTLAATTNQRHLMWTHDIWKFQATISIKALALISALGISTVANDIGLLLGFISPSNVISLIYVRSYDK